MEFLILFGKTFKLHDLQWWDVLNRLSVLLANGNLSKSDLSLKENLKVHLKNPASF